MLSSAEPGAEAPLLKVTVESFDVNDASVDVRRQVGYLPEHNPLYLDMYVKEYLAFMAGIHLPKNSITKRVDEMVEITGLGPEQKKKNEQVRQK